MAITDDILTIDHEQTIFKVLSKAQKDWYYIGRKLGFSDDDLDEIERKYHSDERQCMNKVLLRRIRQGGLTRSMLCESLRGEFVGRDDVAREIEALKLDLVSQKEQNKSVHKERQKKKKTCWHSILQCCGTGLVCFLAFIFLYLWFAKNDAAATQTPSPTTSMILYNVVTNTTLHNLPNNSRLFFGRKNNVTMLTQSLLKQNRIININGPPAYGKSALAVKIGWTLIENNPDIFKEILYIDTKPKSSESIYLCDKKQSKSKSLSVTESQAPPEPDTESNVCDWWYKNRPHKTLLILDNCDSILNSERRQDFLNLITKQFNRCGYKESNLSIIVTSQEKLFFSDDCFQSFSIAELDPKDSVSMLNHYVQNISSEMAHNFSSLAGHCPLALKVIGKMLAASGIENMNAFLDGLNERIIGFISSNKITDHRERFKVIMEHAYANLDIESQECSLAVSLFPSSFESNIGRRILTGIVDFNCIQEIALKSFVDEYFLPNKKRYTMHKLVRSYFLEERSNDSFYVLNQKLFKTNFIAFYSDYLVKVLEYHYKFKNITYNQIFYLENENLEYYSSILINNESTGNLKDKNVLALSLLITENILTDNQVIEEVFKYIAENNNMLNWNWVRHDSKFVARFIWTLISRIGYHYDYRKYRHLLLHAKLYSDIQSEMLKIFSCKNLAFLTHENTLLLIERLVNITGTRDDKELLSVMKEIILHCEAEQLVEQIRVINDLHAPLILTLLWFLAVTCFSVKECVQLVIKHSMFYFVIYSLRNSEILVQNIGFISDFLSNIWFYFLRTPETPRLIISDFFFNSRSALIMLCFAMILILVIRFYTWYKYDIIPESLYNHSSLVLCLTNILVPLNLYFSHNNMPLFCCHLFTYFCVYFLWTQILLMFRENNSPNEKNKTKDGVCRWLSWVHWVIIADVTTKSLIVFVIVLIYIYACFRGKFLFSIISFIRNRFYPVSDISVSAKFNNVDL